MRRYDRRLLVCAVALLAALVAAFGAVPAHAAGDARSVLADCEANGRIDGHHRAEDYRQALAQIPTDVDEYSNCRAQIRTAQLRAAGGSGGSGSALSPAAGYGAGSRQIPSTPGEFGPVQAAGGTPPAAASPSAAPAGASAAAPGATAAVPSGGAVPVAAPAPADPVATAAIVDEPLPPREVSPGDVAILLIILALVVALGGVLLPRRAARCR